MGKKEDDDRGILIYIRTVLNDIVVPGIKSSEKQWQEYNKLNVPKAIDHLNNLNNKITKIEKNQNSFEFEIKNEYKYLNEKVDYHFKLAKYTVIFFLVLFFSLYSKYIIIDFDRVLGIYKKLN